MIVAFSGLTRFLYWLRQFSGTWSVFLVLSVCVSVSDFCIILRNLPFVLVDNA